LAEDHADILPLSEQYHRSRRNLNLTSALLMCWEFIGLEIGSEGKLPFGELPVKIDNPSVVPTVLLFLTFFFLVRFYIEWGQSNENRRRNFFAKSDFLISNILAIIAVSITLLQSTFRINIGGLVAEFTPTLSTHFIALLVGLAVSGIIIGSVSFALKQIAIQRYVSSRGQANWGKSTLREINNVDFAGSWRAFLLILFICCVFGLLGILFGLVPLSNLSLLSAFYLGCVMGIFSRYFQAKAKRFVYGKTIGSQIKL
jgi:hypothetical protein